MAQLNDLGIDLGTSNVLIYQQGKGLVLRRPAVVAIERSTKKVLAIGDDAQRMVGRTPSNIMAIRPLKQGTVADFELTNTMLRFFLNGVLSKRLFSGPRVVMSVPSGVTETEKHSLINILLDAGKKSGKQVAFFSLEMSREQLATRLISNEAFLDNKKLMTGKLSPDDWDSVTVASTALAHTKIFIDDNPSLSVADMNAKCRRVEDLGLVVIDYLQLMQSSGSGTRYAGENRQQVVADISRSLKIMAKELHVPILCLSQLSRANESRSDKRPMLSDLRESGAIEQDADVVMFLYRDDYYNKDSDKHNQAECIIAKNRRGETTTIPLQWLPEFTVFSSMERKYEEPY